MFLIRPLRRYRCQTQRYLAWILANRWLRYFMHLGYGAKGVLYGLIGIFAFNNAIQDSSLESAHGSAEVLISLANYPVGNVILGLLGAGLLGYVLWRSVQAGLDPAHPKKAGIFRTVQRCGYATSGLTYLGIAYTAGKLAFGLTVEREDTIEAVAAFLFERAIGAWLFLAVGLFVIGVGLSYVYGAYSGSYISEFRSSLPKFAQYSAKFIGKVGIAARGLGFILIGLYLTKSAYLAEDDAAGGLGEVLSQLDKQPGGDAWLIAIAFGFIAYAVYMAIAAFYRQFPKADTSYFQC
ncbi:MAG: DUF1206 domain-containing protein [Leptolyngbyaceae cyanobacterium]